MSDKYPGRPTELTPEVQESVCSLVRAGNPFSTAMEAQGLSFQVGYLWLKRGRMQDGEIYIAFLEAVKKARAAFRAEALNNVRSAAALGNWQAAAWLLERTDPEHFSLRRATKLDKEKSRAELELTKARTRALETAGAIDSALGGAIAASAVDDPDAVRSRIATLALKLAPEVYAKMFPTLGAKGDGDGE